MKKQLLIVFILLSAMPIMAQVAGVRPKHNDNHQSQNITLTVIAPRQQSFWLFIDDVLQNENPVHSICISDLWPDEFSIRVELNNEQQNCAGQIVRLLQPETFSIIQKGKCFGLDHSTVHVRPELTIDLVEQIEPIEPDVQNNFHPIPGQGMNPKDYDEAYQMISKESFDNTKLILAKQVVSANSMSASQILGICKLFSFENNKLEFAKFAYRYCIEQNKYYLLNEAFSYDSSKRELDEYIKGL